jgi:hypothetical protein
MQNNENKALWAKLNRTESKSEHFLNKTEQYSRLNNLRINGLTELLFDKDGKQVVRNKDGKIRPIKQNDISETEPKTGNDTQDDSEILGDGDENEDKTRKTLGENADQTTDYVIDKLNKCIPGINLTKSDIDMCHRLGKPNNGGKPRQLIIKFTSRLVRNKVFRLKKNLPKPLFLTEDLTKLTHQVFLSVKLKQPDEIDKCWTANGDIYYKNKVGNVHRVHNSDFDMWLDMPWPKPNKDY